MNDVRQISETALEWSADQETLRVEPWGPHALRIRAAIGPVADDLPGALELPPRACDALVKIEDGTAQISNGL
ncbi:MAG: family 31 glucosidase, partial [Kitasatospora sp.]|nr:family 31 glucosidase [Kitasatospora sp.]